MDDAMIDLMAGDAELRRRLMAFADERLTPDLGASSRMRARVLATAHRRADLARADARLAVLSRPADAITIEDGVTPARLRATAHARRRRTAAVILAAALALSAAAGTALASQAGGALYRARVQLETLTLPAGAGARAAAEVRRLQDRLAEAADATAAGDMRAAQAALAAYDEILDESISNVAIGSDPAATAALASGVRHNLVVLQALASRLPTSAHDGIQQALDNAIQHSTQATQPPQDTGGNGAPGGDGTNHGNGVGVPADPTHTQKPPATTKPPKPTPAATKAPTPAPIDTPQPTRTDRPTKPPKGTKPPIDHKTPVPGPKNGHDQGPGG